MEREEEELTYLCCGGGVGVRDRGKLATSLVTESDRIDPNVWSGDKLAPTLCTMPLLKHKTSDLIVGYARVRARACRPRGMHATRLLCLDE